MCGEHKIDQLTAGADGGSSPRVRGTRRRSELGRGVCRFIPACAGNTSRWSASLGRFAVHPRVCGEHPDGVIINDGDGGSSPRVRGTRSAPRRSIRSYRFIPACAGNTTHTFIWISADTVHPRVCGEHGNPMLIPLHQIGSSPRVRGTRSARSMGAAKARFIPACAGNTATSSAIAATFSVHPRVCGEHSRASQRIRATGGSSPRVRGTLVDLSRWPDFVRFIPACAGNTAAGERVVLQQAVHPRVCGEHSRPNIRGNGDAGSSPRVRGTLPCAFDRSTRLRFIPACAGNTVQRVAARASTTVHPRVCGEHVSMGAAASASAGSSPRVRGTP